MEQEKLQAMQNQHNADDSFLLDAYDIYVENLEVNDDEKELLLFTLNSGFEDLQDIWYDYFNEDENTINSLSAGKSK